MKVRLASAAGMSVLAAGVLSVGLATPALAASSTTQNGLVNVAATNTTVQVPIAVAANICGVTVNALATATSTSPVTCTATGVAIATAPGGGGSSHTTQTGLVNVALTNTTVQVPVGIAANLCGVTANILASGTTTGPATCKALVTSTAG